DPRLCLCDDHPYDAAISTGDCSPHHNPAPYAVPRYRGVLMNTETLKRSIKVCMFDQYGTIVDIQGGLREVTAGFLEGKGWKGSANDFVTWWRRTHFENSMTDALLHRHHTPYRHFCHL